MNEFAAARLQRGVTLIEAMAGLAILGILVGNAVPAFEKFRANRELDGTAAETLSAMQMARSEAISRNAMVRIAYLSAPDGGRCMIVHTGSAASCSCGAGGIPVCSTSVKVLQSQGYRPDARVTVRSNVSSMVIEPVRGMFTLAGKVQMVKADGAEVHHVVTPAGRITTCSPEGKAKGYKPCPISRGH